MDATQTVKLTEVFPNPWNPHRMTEAEMDGLIASVREDGQWRPVLVVEMDTPDEHSPSPPARYRIVDGEHLYKALVSLHLAGEWPDAVRVMVYGKNSEIPAWKQMEIGQTINHGLRGSVEDPDKTRRIYEELVKRKPIEEIAKRFSLGVAGVKHLSSPARVSRPTSLAEAVRPAAYKERQATTVALVFDTPKEMQAFEALVDRAAGRVALDEGLKRGRMRIRVIEAALRALTEAP